MEFEGRGPQMCISQEKELTARKWKWFPRTKACEVPVEKPGWNPNLRAQGSFFFLHLPPPPAPVNILATWLYFHGQFKILERNLEWPFPPSDVKIRKLCRIAKPCAFKECVICCEPPTAKVSSGTVRLLQSWWHCFHTRSGRWARGRLTQGFQNPKRGLGRLDFHSWSVLVGHEHRYLSVFENEWLLPWRQDSPRPPPRPAREGSCGPASHCALALTPL